MQFTTIFTLLALGYGAVAGAIPGTPTIAAKVQAREETTASPTATVGPPKEPGTLFRCTESDLIKDIPTALEICEGVNGKTNSFVDTCCIGTQGADYTKACTDAGGVKDDYGPASCDLTP